jgi:hypothetical protein
MAAEQLHLRLPEELVRRLRSAVPGKERSLFVRQLLEQALDSDDAPLYLAPLDIEGQDRLNPEMAEWESTTLNDGPDEAEEPTLRPPIIIAVPSGGENSVAKFVLWAGGDRGGWRGACRAWTRGR